MTARWDGGEKTNRKLDDATVRDIGDASTYWSRRSTHSSKSSRSTLLLLRATTSLMSFFFFIFTFLIDRFQFSLFRVKMEMYSRNRSMGKRKKIRESMSTLRHNSQAVQLLALFPF